jgi:hypothetical protein
MWWKRASDGLLIRRFRVRFPGDPHLDVRLTRMADIQGRLLTQSLIRRLAPESAVGTSVVVEVLPLLELVVEDFGVVDDDTVQQSVELLCVDPVGALDLAVEPRSVWLDVDVPDAPVQQVPVESGLEL